MNNYSNFKNYSNYANITNADQGSGGVRDGPPWEPGR